MEEEAPWCATFPVGLLAPPQANPRLGVLPPQGAVWRRTRTEPVLFYLCDKSNAIPANKVQKEDMEARFPGRAELFDPVVAQVLDAAASGFMNHFEVLPQDQVKALRLLMNNSHAHCSWAADAVEHLLEAGCYADDNLTLPCVVEELKKAEYDKGLVQSLLTHTNVDKVCALPGQGHTRAHTFPSRAGGTRPDTVLCTSKSLAPMRAIGVAGPLEARPSPVLPEDDHPRVSPQHRAMGPRVRVRTQRAG